MDPAALTPIAAGLSAAMALAWLIQRLTGKSGWVDAIWSLATGAGGIAAALMPAHGAPAHGDIDARRMTVAVLIALWSLRLALHIAGRTRGGGDDPRYAELAQRWGRMFPLYMFIFLQIQAAAALVLVAAVWLAAVNPAPFPSAGDFAGVALLVVAVIGEAMADAQLRRFAHQHKGGVCDTGLWAWSRHPNYFFEWLGWCAWAVMAANLAMPLSFAAVAAPLLMYYLLVHASGIPPLEAHMLASRGDAFRAYQSRTSAFFLLPPKTDKETS